MYCCCCCLVIGLIQVAERLDPLDRALSEHHDMIVAHLYRIECEGGTRGIRWDLIHAGVVVGDYQGHSSHRAYSLHIGYDHMRPCLEHGAQDGVFGGRRSSLTTVEEPQVGTAAAAPR